jgi:hypothetical protein
MPEPSAAAMAFAAHWCRDTARRVQMAASIDKLICAGRAAMREEAAQLIIQVAKAGDESELGERMADAHNSGPARKRSCTDRLIDWNNELAGGIRALPDAPQVHQEKRNPRA